MKKFLIFAVTALLMGCGGDDNDKQTQACPEKVTVLEHEHSKAFPLTPSEYQGSLYQSFAWANTVRDPMRDALEVRTASAYAPLSAEAKEELAALATEKDIISQIGGMGSAKLPDGATSASDHFTAYMNSIIQDNGAGWRAAIQSRAQEVAQVLPDEATFYWQIGNEINAASYTRNAVFYFDNQTGRLTNETFGMKVYIEYFLAPTLQALRAAEVSTGKSIKAALGSVSAFTAPASQQFLNNLLNYEIEGTYAPELTGQKVHELIDIITIHYLAFYNDPAKPLYWRNTLETLYDNWVANNIEGVWVTEEVGINMADGGIGASTALTVTNRYLELAVSRQLSPTQIRWFYYGTNAGPEGQRIDDALTHLNTQTQNTPLTHISTQIVDCSREFSVYGLGTKEDNNGLLILISELSNNNLGSWYYWAGGTTLEYILTGEEVISAIHYTPTGSSEYDPQPQLAYVKGDIDGIHFDDPDTGLNAQESTIAIIR